MYGYMRSYVYLVWKDEKVLAVYGSKKSAIHKVNCATRLRKKFPPKKEILKTLDTKNKWTYGKFKIVRRPIN